MVTIQRKTLLLCLCFLEAIWLLVAQAWGNMVLLLPCLAGFLALVLWAALENMAIPVLLFFLPFAPLLKLKPNTISFFTLALLVVYVVYTATKSRNISIAHFIPALLLITLTLVVKVVNGYDFSNSYILFCTTLLLIPFIQKEMEEDYGFYWLTVCFVCGICLAAITSQYLAVYPSISRYISTIDILDAVRRSGYYSDPNFYSAIITMALSGVLVLLSNQVKKARVVVLISMALLLIYCGLLSVSKTFLLVTACLFVIWGLDFMFQRGKMSAKLTMIAIAVVAVCFFLSSTVFTDLLDVILVRFSLDNNLSDLTTGRTDLWVNYLHAFGDDPMLLLFGQGYTRLLVGGRASHNTLIQMVFQFGIVGSLLLVTWQFFFVRTLLTNVRNIRMRFAQIALMVLGAFGPWLALDYLFLDEFFLSFVYVCIASRYLANQSVATESLTEGND